MQQGEWELEIGARHLTENLASELYSDRGACLWEVVRNGFCACMPSDDMWIPERARVEISLAKNHPLAPKSTALVVLDYGCGFTDPRIKKFRKIGRSCDDPREE